MRWFVQHWRLKLLALVLSLGLFVAVAFQQNPISTLATSAPISYDGLASNQILLGAPSTIKVTLVGLVGNLRAVALNPVPVIVHVNCGHLSSGPQVLYGRPQVFIANVRPDQDQIPFSVRVDERSQAVLKPEPRLTFAPGWEAVKTTLTVPIPGKPDNDSVHISGPASFLRDLKAFVTYPEPIAASIPGVTNLPIILSVDGKENVPIPSTFPPTTVDALAASLSVEARKPSQTRRVPLLETPTGNPAAGYRITAITIDPLFIDIVGPTDELLKVDSITLPSFSVEGRTATLVQQVRVNLPGGVSGSVGTVSVTVAIQQNPVVQPSPPPTPSPSPKP
jgi:hypothetical protein